ncbi:biotin synthase BioB [Acidaminobacter sp. JC074]|uniref:biotin synthase BioB n=1 Tax=Acidaminobacter sp. JC074 TaxID=2530199 RepID=UPI001F0D0C24|nr:biotin synthase BioB [Acidaminobacter sp. JC074]MCH4888066.1 biotin synthase BioB [Acidaminobacter sp. JC074]
MKKAILKLFDLPLDTLMSQADDLRRKYYKNHFDLCSINNIKSGKCSEDCSFCSQSIHFKTDSPAYDLIDQVKAFTEAKSLSDQGVHKHSLVSSGRHLDELDLENLLPIYKTLDQTPLSLCASHGLITEEQALKLKAIGVKRYHHNLESSESYYPEICTTHTYQDRIDTIKVCQKVGLEVCSGGIWGLGESRQDRIDMLLTLKELDVDSVPINILCPIKGTPLEDMAPLDPEEIMKTLCIYRIVLKDKEVRLAGGRVKLENLEQVYKCGVNGILTGDYLTTTGFSVKKDIELLVELGYTV